MTKLTFATGTLAGAAATAIALLPQLSAGSDAGVPAEANPPGSCQSISCEFAPSPEAMRIEHRLESHGYTCSEAATLTNTIIVDVERGADVVGFDHAQQIASEGRGWLRSYCER